MGSALPRGRRGHKEQGWWRQDQRSRSRSSGQPCRHAEKQEVPGGEEEATIRALVCLGCSVCLSVSGIQTSDYVRVCLFDGAEGPFLTTSIFAGRKGGGGVTTSCATYHNSMIHDTEQNRLSPGRERKVAERLLRYARKNNRNMQPDVPQYTRGQTTLG